MQRFIFRRFLAMVPTILIVTMVVYGLLLITPGQDPANLLLGEEADAFHAQVRLTGFQVVFPVGSKRVERAQRNDEVPCLVRHELGLRKSRPRSFSATLIHGSGATIVTMKPEWNGTTWRGVS